MRGGISFIVPFLAWLLCWWSILPRVAWAAAVSKATSASFSTTNLQSMEHRQLAILDGAEWDSIQRLFDDGSSALSKFGYMRILAGKDEQGRRVVGMQVPGEDSQIYTESVAPIPDKVGAVDATSTYIAGVSTVHSVLPQVEKVGGSDVSIATGGKVVVLGGNDLACFASQGLLKLGVDVCLVSTGNPKVKSSSRAGGKCTLMW